MATFRHASTGFLMLDGQVLTKSIEVDVEYDANVDVLITNTGDAGFTTPVATTVKLTCKNAVPVSDTERKIIQRRFESRQINGFTYVSAGSQLKFTAALNSLMYGSVSNRADTFNFGALGVAEPTV